MITETDDYFCHQICEPHAYVQSNDPWFADRAYAPVADPERFAIDIGVSMYPNSDHVEAYAIATTPGVQHCLRATREIASDRWRLGAGPIQAQIIEPLKRWRWTCEPNPSGIAFDVDYVARHEAYAIRQPAVRHLNRLILDDIYVFQPGFYTGWVEIDGQKFDFAQLAGQRDRTWGTRVFGEGQVPRGAVVWLAAEFDDVSVMAYFRERHNGSRHVTDGAIFHHGGGPIVPVVEIEHDLKFDYDSRKFVEGSWRLVDADGQSWEVHAEARLVLHLSGAGYTSTDQRRGLDKFGLWTEACDLTDPDVVARIEGLNDNVCVITCDERRGHGVVETSLGSHARYQVAPPKIWT